MALAEETSRILHAGNGTRGPFSLSVGGTPITYADASHIVITRYDVNGVGTVQVNGDDYTLSAASVLPDVGEAVQTVTEATFSFEAGEAVLAVGEHVLAERISPPSQDLILPPSGGFPSAAGERTFDAILRLVQELREKSNRVVTINALDPTGGLEIPAEATRANMVLGFDADGAIELLDNTFVGPQGPPGETGATGATGASGNGSGDMVKTENLSGLSNYTTARSNLGLGSAALLASSAVFQVSNNLSEGNATTMRTNLGLGTAALLSPAANINSILGAADYAAVRTLLSLTGIATMAETTTAEFLANTADRVLTTDQVNAAGAIYALTDAATVAIDGALGLNFSLTIGGNRTLGAMTNPIVGRSGYIYVTQDGTGSRTLAYHANYKWAGGVAGVLSTAAGAIDRIGYFVKSSTHIDLSLAKDLS